MISKDVVPTCLQYISHNNKNALSLIHVPMEEHDHIMDEKNQIESIKFDRPVSIGTQDTTYDYNEKFWDYI